MVQNAGPTPQISIQEVALPDCGNDEVLIRLSYSGICHADVAFAYDEFHQLGFGMTEGNCTPGHEGVGHVVAIGATVANLKVGDRVSTKWLCRVCGTCKYCANGSEHLCHERTIYGHARPGSLQQYVTSQAIITPKIPDGVPMDKAGPLVCAGVTIFRAIKMSKASSGEWIVIFGAGGGLGHLGIQFAKKMGIRVIGIDSGDKRDFCVSLGVDAFIDFQISPDMPDEVRKVTGDGAVGVLVPTGGCSSYEQAARMLGPEGTLICIGLPSAPLTIPIQVLDIITGGFNIVGVNASGVQHIEKTLEFAARHNIRPITQLLPMEKASEAFELLRGGRAHGRVVLDLR